MKDRTKRDGCTNYSKRFKKNEIVFERKEITELVEEIENKLNSQTEERNIVLKGKRKLIDLGAERKLSWKGRTLKMELEVD